MSSGRHNESLGNDATVEAVRGAHDRIHAATIAGGDTSKHRALHLEGYASTGHRYLHHLKKESIRVPIVNAPPRGTAGGTGGNGNTSISATLEGGGGALVARVDAVGGAMLLIAAELHRQGLIFPAFPYRHRIETEGLSMMALDMGVFSWGMPSLEVLHH